MSLPLKPRTSSLTNFDFPAFASNQLRRNYEDILTELNNVKVEQVDLNKSKIGMVSDVPSPVVNFHSLVVDKGFHKELVADFMIETTGCTIRDALYELDKVRIPLFKKPW